MTIKLVCYFIYLVRKEGGFLSASQYCICGRSILLVFVLRLGRIRGSIYKRKHSRLKDKDEH
jgi:hypothetical protein